MSKLIWLISGVYKFEGHFFYLYGNIIELMIHLIYITFIFINIERNICSQKNHILQYNQQW